MKNPISVVLMGKNTMMRKAIRGHLESNPALEKYVSFMDFETYPHIFCSCIICHIETYLLFFSVLDLGEGHHIQCHNLISQKFWDKSMPSMVFYIENIYCSDCCSGSSIGANTV